MARAETGIRDIVAYSQRPIVTEQAVESVELEFLLIVCGTNKTVYLEAKRQLQHNYFRDDEAILKVVWLAIDESWREYQGVTYETLNYLVRRELSANDMVLMQHHIDGLFAHSAEGLLYTIANPGIEVTSANAELARCTLRRTVIARGVLAPVRRIMQATSTQQVPTELCEILTRVSRIHTDADTVATLPLVDMAPEFGTEMQTQLALTPTGTAFLDTAIGGQRAGEVYGLLGPTGGGKTTLGIHVAVTNATACWLNAQATGERPKLVIYITAEESAVLMRPRVWSAFFRIHRDIASQQNPFSHMSTQETLRPYELDDQRGQPRIMSESERYVLRRDALNTCFAVLDLSGSADFPSAGTGYVDEIETHITRLVEDRGGQEVSMVVIDYAGLVVQRYMETNSIDEEHRRVLLKYFANKCRQQIAERFNCPVWVLHQLNGDATSGANVTSTKKLHHTEAADSKSFAENMVACGVLGSADAAHGIRLLNWSKTRNKANEQVSPTYLKIHPDFSLMVDVSTQYVISESGTGFLSVAEANSVGVVPNQQRRAARPVLAVNEVPDVSESDLEPVD